MTKRSSDNSVIIVLAIASAIILLAVFQDRVDANPWARWVFVFIIIAIFAGLAWLLIKLWSNRNQNPRQ